MNQHPDNFNPYAPGPSSPPPHALGSAGGRAPGDNEDMHEAPPFSVGNAMGLGWVGFTRRYPLLLGASALYLLIYFAGEIFASITALFTLLPLVSWAASVLFYPVLGLGLLQIGFLVVRGKPTGVGDLFAGFGRYWPIVGANLLVIIATWVIMLVPIAIAALLIGILMPAMSGGGGPNSTMVVALIIVGVVIAVVPFLLIYPRLMFAPMVCLDTEIRTSTVTESFSISWRMTGARGVRGGIIGLVILILLIGLLSLLLLILPALFFAMPFGIAVYGAAYWQISRNYWASQDHCCRGCGYDLRRTPGERCPECGAFIPESQRANLAN